MNILTVLKSSLDTLDIGIILTNQEGKIIFFNDYLKKYLGIYSYEDLKINELFELFSEDSAVDPQVITGYPQARVEGLVYEKEPLVLNTNKNLTRIISLKSYKNNILFDNGISNLITIRDFEERAELEKMKVDFSSQTVHILRTPLTVIRNNLESILKSPDFLTLDAKSQKNLLEIKYGTQELLSLVQNLVTINEIENSKIELQVKETPIIGVVKTAISDLEEVKLKTNNQVIIIEPLYELPLVKIDTLKILSVIKSVVLNSLKHTLNGLIKVTLSKQNKYLSISIEDNGEGITATGLKFIFNKFYHSKKNALTMEEGLGIGLFYCKKIIEAHLGKIEVESEKDKGTKITILLPI
jgi:signal transduction histidine kinase